MQANMQVDSVPHFTLDSCLYTCHMYQAQQCLAVFSLVA